MLRSQISLQKTRSVNFAFLDRQATSNPGWLQNAASLLATAPLTEWRRPHSHFDLPDSVTPLWIGSQPTPTAELLWSKISVFPCTLGLAALLLKISTSTSVVIPYFFSQFHLRSRSAERARCQDSKRWAIRIFFIRIWCRFLISIWRGEHAWRLCSVLGTLRVE